MNAARREIRRLAYISPVTAAISVGMLCAVGGMVGAALGIAEWLRVRRIARSSAVASSFGSGWSFDWTSMTNAELTAEKRPAYEKGKGG